MASKTVLQSSRVSCGNGNKKLLGVAERGWKPVENLGEKRDRGRPRRNGRKASLYPKRRTKGVKGGTGNRWL